jgi:hypothetical protein
MTVPTRSAVTSRKFGGSTSGGRDGVGSGLLVMESRLAQPWHWKGEAEPATFRCHCDTGLLKPIWPARCGIAHGSASPGRGTIGRWHWPGRSEARVPATKGWKRASEHVLKLALAIERISSVEIVTILVVVAVPA